MKKRRVLICFIMMAVLTGCGNAGTAERVVEPPAIEAEEEQPAAVSAAAAETADTEGIDVDLTKLSSTMVYAEVYNMMIAPDNYVGKTVKMKGMFSTYNDEVTNKTYYACIIADATACCSQGIEFVLTDDYKYPDDYPEEAEDICVTGVFDTYQQDGFTYCTLRNARLG